MSERRPDIISRGPETIPTRGWQLQAYLRGKRFFEPVLPGQRFPEGAGQKQLDELALQRRFELNAEAARQTTAAVTDLDLPEAGPEAEAERPGVPDALAA